MSNFLSSTGCRNGWRVLVGVLAVLLAGQTASARQNFVAVLEAEDETGSLTEYVGTPTGSNSLLVIAADGQSTVGDTDGRVNLRYDGGPANAEIIEEFPFDIVAENTRLKVLLVQLDLGDSPPFQQATISDEELSAGDLVQWRSYNQRIENGEARGLSFRRNRIADSSNQSFKLVSPTTSTSLQPTPLGGWVFDLCGGLRGVGVSTVVSGPVELISISRIDSALKANSVAEDFVLAEPCTDSSGASKAALLLEARLREKDAREQELLAENRKIRDDAEAARRALEDAENRQAIEAARQDIEDVNKKLEENQKDLVLLQDETAQIREEKERLVNAANTAIDDQNKAAEQVRIGTYLLAGIGVITLLALGFLIWFFTRSRNLKRELATAEDEKRDIQEAKAAAELRWFDCVLENDQGLTVKLPGSKLPKTRGGVTLGRSREDADVVVDKDDVSRRHARFEVTDDTLSVTDLGSTNKTRVDGNVLDHGVPRPIHEGTRLRFGTNEFVLRIMRKTDN